MKELNGKNIYIQRNNDKYFQILWKKTNLHIQETQWISSMIKATRSTKRHIIVKMLKAKRHGENHESSKRKPKYHLQGNPIRLIANLSSETMEARRQRKNIFQVLKITKNCQPRILYPPKLSLNNKCEIKTFLDQHNQSICC